VVFFDIELEFRRKDPTILALGWSWDGHRSGFLFLHLEKQSDLNIFIPAALGVFTYGMHTFYFDNQAIIEINTLNISYLLLNVSCHVATE